MVLGIWGVDAMVRDGWRWVVKRESRDSVGLVDWLGNFVRMKREWRDMQLSFS